MSFSKLEFRKLTRKFVPVVKMSEGESLIKNEVSFTAQKLSSLRGFWEFT